MKRSVYRSASVTALALALAMPAGAQVAAPEPPVPPATLGTAPADPPKRATDSNAPRPANPEAASGTDTQEIVVTAQKTSEVASKIPLALSVFSGQALQQQGVTSVQNLTGLAPGVVIGNAAQGANIAIRGVQSTDPSSKGEQSNVFNVDGIPIGRPQIIGLSFFDLERVEVLRGPQGTLYGKSSTGGAINVITAKPKNQLEAALTGEYGNYNAKRLEAMVNVPLTDTLAVRGAFDVNKRDGYVYPTLVNPAVPKPANAPVQAKLNDENNWTARLSARWNYLPNGSVIVTGTFGHVGGTGNVNNGILYNRYLNNSGRAERTVYYNPMAGKLDDDFYVINGEINQDIGPVHLSYDGAHIDFNADDNKFPQTGDPGGAPGTPSYSWAHYVAHIRTDSHELRLSNANPSRLEWVIGANYYNERIPEKDQNWATLASCAPSLAASCNSPNPVIFGTTRHKSEGVFGQANFHLTDKLKLTGGVRYSHDDANRNATIFAGGGTFLGANGQPCGPLNLCVSGGLANVGQFKGSKVTWRVGADYQLTPNQLVYASIATGYKPGSFNDVDPTKPGSGSQPYGAETLTAYEIGYKGKILPSLQLNSSAYYYDYSRFQLTGATFLTPSITGGNPLVLIYTTIVPVKMYGWENQLTWRPARADTIGLDLTLNAGHYSGQALVGFIYTNRVDFNGNRLDLLPHLTTRFSWEHRFYLANGAYFNARVNTAYNAGYYVSDLGGSGNPFSGIYDVLPQQYKQKAFTRTDLNFGFTTASGKFSIEGFVRNIENDLQLLTSPQQIQAPSVVAALGNNRATVRVSDPRFFGVRASIRY